MVGAVAFGLLGFHHESAFLPGLLICVHPRAGWVDGRAVHRVLLKLLLLEGLSSTESGAVLAVSSYSLLPLFEDFLPTVPLSWHLRGPGTHASS